MKFLKILIVSLACCSFLLSSIYFIKVSSVEEKRELEHSPDSSSSSSSSSSLNSSGSHDCPLDSINSSKPPLSIEEKREETPPKAGSSFALPFFLFILFVIVSLDCIFTVRRNKYLLKKEK